MTLQKPTVALIVGTRPQIIKSAVIFHELHRRKIPSLVIDTGQHYDHEMSGWFMKHLGYSDVLRIRAENGREYTQVASITSGVGKVFHEHKPKLALIPGDTNSALGAAIAAQKEHIPIAHLEAGPRSYDLTLPEEINRKIIDHCSTILFAPSQQCARNLRKEGIRGGHVKIFGDTMYDLLKQSMPTIKKSSKNIELGSHSRHAVLTVHRQATVDDDTKLGRLIEVLASEARIEFIFPLHPRTRRNLVRSKLLHKITRTQNIRLTKPLSYFDMLSLVYRCDLVLTDSGGLQKEAFWLGVPCITLRDSTEWTEIVKLGANILTGLSENKIRTGIDQFMSQSNMRSRLASMRNPYGDGKAATRIVDSVQKFLRNPKNRD